MASQVAVRNLATSSTMKWAVGGWSLFIAENFVLSENRTYLISRLGDNGYHIAYGTLSTAAMGAAMYGYIRKVRHTKPLLWSLQSPVPAGAKALGFACLAVGAGLLSQIPPSAQIPVALVSNREGHSRDIHADGVTSVPTEQREWGVKVRCPFDFTDKRTGDGPVHGVERITRHPGLWSLGLLGLGSAFLVPSVPQRAWLAMPALVALVGGAHTDSRFRRGMGGTLPPRYDDVTSNVPFVAMVSGAQGNVLESAKECWAEAKPLNALIAVGVSAIWVGRKGRGVRLLPR